MTSPEPTNDAVSDERLREIEGWAKLVSTFPQAEGHPPPERYADIAAVCTELIARRSVTSQASEGAGPDEFAVGMAVAAGIAISAHGAETVAEEILRAGNLDTLKAMRVAGVDRYDIRLCLPVLKHIRDKSASRRQALQGGRS